MLAVADGVYPILKVKLAGEGLALGASLLPCSYRSAVLNRCAYYHTLLGGVYPVARRSKGFCFHDTNMSLTSYAAQRICQYSFDAHEDRYPCASLRGTGHQSRICFVTSKKSISTLFEL